MANCNEIFTASTNGRAPLYLAARRPGAAASISLSKRRAWFVEGDGAGTGAGTGESGGAGAGDGSGTQGDGAAAGAGDTHGDWFRSLPPAAQREIEDLRKENAKARQDRIKAQDDARKADEQRLIDQNEYKKLADQRLAEIERLKPLESRFQTLEEEAKESNARRIAAIPDSMRVLVPTDYEPLRLQNWLNASAAIFAAPRAPQMGAGAAGDGVNTAKPKLTPDQQATARKFGLTDEEFIKNM